MPSADGRCERPPLLGGWLPLIVALVGTFILSSIPGHRLPPLGEWNADKLLHGVEYAVIGALFVRPLDRSSWGLSRPVVAILVATCLASVWGALDEVHQLFTPNRSCDWRDWLADTLGALVGALVYGRVLIAHRRWRLGAPGQDAAGKRAPGTAAPGESAAGEGAPGKTAAGEGAPGKAAAGDGAPVEGAPGEGAR